MSIIEQIIGTVLIILLFWFDYKLVKHTINPTLKEFENNNTDNKDNNTNNTNNTNK